jgi:WD40 repeat protein
VAFFPDGRRLLGIVTAGGQSSAQIFNVETQLVEDSFPAPYLVYEAALSPDGQTLAWAFDDFSVRLVRLSDHQETAFMEGHINMIVALKFSPAGDRLYSASHDGTVRIWGLDGKALDVIQPGGEIVGMGLSPDGSRLAIIPSEGNTVMWDIAKDRKLTEYEGAIFGGYDGSEAVFSPDGKYFAASLGGGGAISLWRLSDGALLWRGGTFAAAFSPDSTIFAHSDWDVSQNGVIVLRSADGQQVLRTISDPMGMAWRLVFSPDSARLVSFDGNRMRLWQVDTGDLLYTSLPACPP